jgi:hypothetical protein
VWKKSYAILQNKFQRITKDFVAKAREKKMAEKKVLLVLVLAAIVAGGVFAQNASGLDFSSTAPQFFSFDLGAGVGYALDDKHESQLKGITAIGFKVAVIDSLEVGVDVLSTLGAAALPAFAGLRIGYRFTPALGVAIGLGQAAVLDATANNNNPDPKPGISLGVFYDIFAKRSTNGIATALKVRVDYVTETSDVAKGARLFTPVFTLGL